MGAELFGAHEMKDSDQVEDEGGRREDQRGR